MLYLTFRYVYVYGKYIILLTLNDRIFYIYILTFNCLQATYLHQTVCPSHFADGTPFDPDFFKLIFL